jgi:hypothetical protein
MPITTVALLATLGSQTSRLVSAGTGTDHDFLDGGARKNVICLLPWKGWDPVSGAR